MKTDQLLSNIRAALPRSVTEYNEYKNKCGRCCSNCKFVLEEYNIPYEFVTGKIIIDKEDISLPHSWIVCRFNSEDYILDPTILQFEDQLEQYIQPLPEIYFEPVKSLDNTPVTYQKERVNDSFRSEDLGRKA